MSSRHHISPRYSFGETQTGDTALTFAAGAGRTECVQLLLEGGADTEAKNGVRDMAYYFPGLVSVNTPNCFYTNNNTTDGRGVSMKHAARMDGTDGRRAQRSL